MFDLSLNENINTQVDTNDVPSSQSTETFVKRVAKSAAKIDPQSINIDGILDLSAKQLEKANKDTLVVLVTRLQTFIRSPKAVKVDTEQEAQGQELSTTGDSGINAGSSAVVMELIHQLQNKHGEYITLLKEQSEGKLEATRKILESEFSIRAKEAELERLKDSLRVANEEKSDLQAQLHTERTRGQNSSGDMASVLGELKLRQEKETNLVVYGIEEKEGEEEEKATLNTLLRDTLGCENAEPIKFFRLGKPRDAGDKPRPLKVFMDNVDVKEKILRHTYKLRGLPADNQFRRVFVRADLTPLQRQMLQKDRDMNAFGSGGVAIPSAGAADFPPLPGYGTRGRGGHGARGFRFGWGRGTNGSFWSG